MIAPHSTTRVRTTHVGSLIRPAELLQFIRPKQAGQPYDEQAYAKCLRASVEAAVRRQVDAGIDVVSDGEFGKSISWSQYALERLSGFERRAARPGGVRRADFVHRPRGAAARHRKFQVSFGSGWRAARVPAGRLAHERDPRPQERILQIRRGAAPRDRRRDASGI